MAMAMASKGESSSSSSNSSWVDISSNRSSPRGTPTAAYAFNPEEAVRILQKELDQSSDHSSRANSRKTSTPSTPKSPPNSPRSPPGSPSSPRSSLRSEMESVQQIVDPYWSELYLTGKEARRPFSDYLFTIGEENLKISDHFSSRPTQRPPKRWAFRSPDSGAVVIPHACAKDENENKKMFSRKGVCVLVFTNVLSLILGGLGVMLIRMHWKPSLFSIQLRNLQ